MLEYLQKYNQLPAELKQRFSAPAVVAAIKELEASHNIKLGIFVIKILVGDIKMDQGASWLSANFKLAPAQANALMLELKTKVFAPKAIPQPTPGWPVAETVAPLPPTEPTADLESRLEQVVKAVKVNFASQELHDRFRKIMLTHLKGIRDKISTKEALVKSVETGGLGFDLNSAENILRLVAEGEPRGEIKTPPGQMPETARPVARDVEYDLASAIKARQAAQVVQPVEEELLAPPTPMVESQPASNEPMPIKVAPVAPPAKQAVENLRRTESGKIKMDDIHGSPRVFTPVDEIKYMTVKNFRNLSPDPLAAIEIIKKKIKALAQEDYTKKIAGIQGWKTSPVNRMYIEAYQDAINEGKSITVVLDKKLQNNPEFINEAEFEAILKLNQDLKGMVH